MKGKFIVLYGANNLGKSTQANFLVKALIQKGLNAQYVKYPIYHLSPTGQIINAVLRQGKKMSELKFQKIYVQNRRDYEPILRETLDKGIWVVAEDYVGTGIAWGMVRGIPLEKLEKMNDGLYRADISILLYGNRFESGKEINHRNENDLNLWEKAQQKHLFLAERYGWEKVHANQSIKKVHEQIMKYISTLFSRKK